MRIGASSSIRSRLIASLLVALVVILGYTTLNSYSVSRHEADEVFGARLATSARILEALVANQVAKSTLSSPIVIKLPKELEALPVANNSEFGHPYEAKIAFQIWRDDGLLLVRSFSAPDTPLGVWKQGFSEQTVAGEKWQVFTLRSNEAWVQVAEQDGIRDELTHDIAVAVMTPLIIGSFALLLVANLVVRFGLNPLTELAEGIGKRSPESLSEIKIDDVPREMAPVIKALNALLSGIKEALARERRFTDAAAHELRTPLAALKIHADNLVRAETEEQRQRSTKNLIKGLDRSLRLANQMLILSRTQSGVDHEILRRICLSEILQEILAQQEPVLATRGQHIETDGLTTSDACVLGDELKLHQLFRNLFDNASRYGSPDSTIRISLQRKGEEIFFSIANEGAMIPENMRDKIFEPYTRLAGQAAEGNGLGLAIVREVAKQHGATISLDTLTSGSGTVITVVFPYAESSAT
jgi:two-component system sensor histidine kinase QseC